MAIVSTAAEAAGNRTGPTECPSDVGNVRLFSKSEDPDYDVYVVTTATGEKIMTGHELKTCAIPPPAGDAGKTDPDVGNFGNCTDEQCYPL